MIVLIHDCDFFSCEIVLKHKHLKYKDQACLEVYDLFISIHISNNGT